MISVFSKIDREKGQYQSRKCCLRDPSTLDCMKTVQFINQVPLCKHDASFRLLPKTQQIYPVMQILGPGVSIWINQCLLEVHDGIKNGTSRIES